MEIFTKKCIGDVITWVWGKPTDIPPKILQVFLQGIPNPTLRAETAMFQKKIQLFFLFMLNETTSNG